MRIGLVTDSCCDLPREFLDAHDITILPITIEGDGRQFVDRRDPYEAHAFYQRQAKSAIHDFKSLPYSTEQIRELFLSRLIVEYDFVFCITVLKGRSPIFANASEAANQILTEYRPLREKFGIKTPFALRVFDSNSLFPGQGLIVAEAAKMIAKGQTSTAIRRHLTHLTHTVQAFLVPSDLAQLRNQARSKGDKSVSFLSYALGTALDIKPLLRAYQGVTAPVAKIRGFENGIQKLFSMVIAQIKGGKLNVPLLCVSYGGDPAVVAVMPAYKQLVSIATSYGVDVLLAEMSTTGGVNIGAGGIALAFSADEEATFD